MPQTQYQQVGDGISHLGRVAQNIALGLAQQRYQQAQQQQMMQLRNQELQSQQAVDAQRINLMQHQGRKAMGDTMLSEARTGAVDNAEGTKDALKQAIWMLMMSQNGQKAGVDMGGRDDIARARIASEMGGLPDAARSKLPENIAQMSQMDDPRMQQMLATGTKMTASVSPGATLFDTLNLQPLISSPRTLGQGQALVPNEAGQVGPEKQFAPSAGNTLSLNTALQTMSDPSKFLMLPENVKNTISNLVSSMNAQGQIPRAGLTNQPLGMDIPPTQIVSPKSQEEFDALPVGTIFINPADGRQMKKK